MTLAELIARFRVESNDLVAPYLSSDANITDWLNEAEEEAAIRASLIHDSSTVAVCSIAVTAPTTTYALHASVLDITRAAFTPTGSSAEVDLYLTDRVEQDRAQAGWRTRVDTPRQLIQADKTVRLGCIPSVSGALAIECYRLPLAPMAIATPAGTPEIAGVHHRRLVQWALHKCYSRPDAEIYDPGRAAKAEAEFARVFGLRPDASYRRDSQANRPLFNKAIW